MAAAPLGPAAPAAGGALLDVPLPPATATAQTLLLPPPLPLPLAAAPAPTACTAPAAPSAIALPLALPHAGADQPTAAAAIRALSAALLVAAAAASSSTASSCTSSADTAGESRAVTPLEAEEQPPSMQRQPSAEAHTEAAAESSASGAAAAAAIAQAESSDMVDDGASSTSRPRVSLLTLPAELLHLIFAHLLPRAESSVYPAASWATLPPTHAFIHLGAPQALRPLLALSLVCRTTSAVALPLLYAAPTLERTRQARLLARTLALSPSSATLARAIRHLVFPQDGLLYASDQLADQQAWGTSLGAVFKAARALRSVWITARPQGCSLAAFLAPGVQARPSRVTINSFSPSPVPLHEFDLSPLTQVTHLHLIQVLPAPELLALFSGQAQPAAPQRTGAGAAAPSSYASIAAAGQQAAPALERAESGTSASSARAGAGASNTVVLPQPPLTHLRLSSLPPFALHDFGDYVTYRRALAAHAALPAPLALQSNAPQAPARTTSSALKAQAALYELALCVRRMPELRRLTLELCSLGTLDEPEWAMAPAVSATAVLDGTGGPGSPYEASTGQLATLDFPSDVPVTLAEAREWAVRETENARANERSRTAPRDAYWLDVRMGLEALRELVAQASGREEVEVRLCAARPGGWDRHEARAESAAMVSAASSSSSMEPIVHAGSSSARAARRVSAEKAEAHYARARASVDGGLAAYAMPQETQAERDADDDGTAFSDPDIFELAETRPLLGYQSSTASRRGSAAVTAAAHSSSAAAAAARPTSADEAGDERKQTTLWWTGELPRINSGPD